MPDPVSIFAFSELLDLFTFALLVLILGAVASKGKK